MENIIPQVITVQWVATLVIAFIVGIIVGKLLRVALWLAFLVLIIFLILQFIIITPALTFDNFFDAEKLAQMGAGFVEWVKNLGPHIKEHLIANTAALIALIAGFIVSFLIGKS